MVAPIVAASAISGLSSLASGLLGRKGNSASDQRKAMMRIEKQKYGWIVEGAQKAGFNPLTALRAGGGGMTQPAATPLSTGAVIGNAIADAATTGLNTWASTRVDPIEKESRILDNELKRQQLQNIQNEQTRYGLTSVPAVRQSSSPTKSGPLTAPASAGQIGTARGGLITNPVAYDEYGNPAQADTSLYGSFVSGDLVHDARTAINRQFLPPPLRAPWADWQDQIRNASTQVEKVRLQNERDLDMRRRADNYYGRVTPTNRPPVTTRPQPVPNSVYIPYQPAQSAGTVR